MLLRACFKAYSDWKGQWTIICLNHWSRTSCFSFSNVVEHNRCALMRWSFFFLNDHTKLLFWRVSDRNTRAKKRSRKSCCFWNLYLLLNLRGHAWRFCEEVGCFFFLRKCTFASSAAGSGYLGDVEDTTEETRSRSGFLALLRNCFDSETLALHERILLLHNNPQSMRYLSHRISYLAHIVPAKPLCALGLWANL